jgi:hypothetical protein
MPPTVQAPLVIIIMIIASECNPGVFVYTWPERRETAAAFGPLGTQPERRFTGPSHQTL